MKRIYVAVALLLAAGLAAFLLLRRPDGSFTGDLVKNSDSYQLDIEYMNGTDSHTLQLRAGDVLRVEFKTEKGSLHMEILSPDGAALYSGNGTEAPEFTVNIPADGAYTVTVEARRASGTLHIRAESPAAP